jgi:glucokinase
MAKKIKKDRIASIDLGATFIKTGILDTAGRIISKNSFSTKDYSSRDSLIDKIALEINSAIGSEKARFLGLGIGVPGPVDYKKGIVHSLTNVKGWSRVGLRGLLRKRLGMDVFVDNDANAACIGEARWGAGKGYKDIVCLTLGSGIGTAVMIDGRVYRGRGYSAAEMGHICIDRHGPKCNCGGNGCIEAFTGNSYIVKAVVKRLRHGEKSILLGLAKGRYSNITPQLIDIAARKGDRFSIKIWQEMGENLGIALAGIVNTFNPEIIVIGGGLSKAGKRLFDSIRLTVKQRAMKVFTGDLKIKQARFIEDAGTIGAAALALEAQDQNHRRFKRQSADCTLNI